MVKLLLNVDGVDPDSKNDLEAVPPIRTRDTKSRGKSQSALPRFGFTRGIGLEANERAIASVKQGATQSAGEATMRLTSEIGETRLFDKGTETHAIGESEEAREFAPTQAELAVKGAKAAQKTAVPMNKGLKEATFRKVAFGSGFVLKDQHIYELTSIGPRLCRSLTSFEFHFKDVSYDAKNSAQELTDKAIIYLTKLCPKLRSVQLQGTSGLQDITLEALFENCADISCVEITTHSNHGNSRLDGSALDKLREHPQWGTKLKKLRLPDQGTKCDSLTKAVRALTKERDKLLVQLVCVSEVKKWGDWELEVWHTNFRKGRKQSLF